MNYDHLFTELKSAKESARHAEKMKEAVYHQLVVGYTSKIHRSIQDAIKSGDHEVLVDTEGLRDNTLDDLATALRFKEYKVIVRHNIEGNKKLLPGLKISWKPELEPAGKY